MSGTRISALVESVVLSRCLLFLFMLVPIVLLGSQSALAVVYVDRDRPAGGNGTSWAQAYNSLEVALAAYPATAQEFWIAEGTYTPSSPLILFGGQNNSFYGGFAGTETALSQRDIAAHPVIIDGQGALAHIFYATSYVDSVRFDGLTIQGGAAMGDKNTDAGVGGGIIINMLSTAVIANCTFKNNTANGLGGAVVVYNTTMLITGSTFINNTSIQSGGGAVSLYWDQIGTQPAATIEKSLFQGNRASLDGGAVYEGRYSLSLEDSTFIDNTSPLEAGALKLDYKNGGGVTKIERCLFFKNSITGSSGGGAIQSFEQSFEVENSVFAFNSALGSNLGGGGALFLNAGTNAAYSVTVKNSTFYGNRTDGWGGAICSSAVPMLYLYNSILWGNSGVNSFWPGDEPTNDLANLSGSSLTTRYSDIQTLTWNHGSAGESNTGSFSADPLFVDPDGSDNVAGTADDNLSIQSASPCTDHADGDYAPPTDFASRPRTDSSVADLGTGTPSYADVGAYEGPYTPSGPPPPPPRRRPRGRKLSLRFCICCSETKFQYLAHRSLYSLSNLGWD